MKLEAIVSRGTKRDFIDIYVLAQEYSLSLLLDFYEQKFHTLNEKEMMILKSLVYFDNADEDEDPVLLKPILWKEVKSFLISETKKLTV
mgnify:CR=1 FL=1